jgi:hypothetical protein
MYGILLSEGEGGEAVGRVARIASKVAVVTGGGAVGGTGNGELNEVAVGARTGDGNSGLALAVGANGDNGDRDLKSPSRVARHTTIIINKPTPRPRTIANCTRRVMSFPQWRAQQHNAIIPSTEPKSRRWCNGAHIGADLFSCSVCAGSTRSPMGRRTHGILFFFQTQWVASDLDLYYNRFTIMW